jgi:hypothetical protein
MRYEAIESPKDCRHRVYFYGTQLNKTSGWVCKHPNNYNVPCPDDDKFPPADKCPLKVIFW